MLRVFTLNSISRSELFQIYELYDPAVPTNGFRLNLRKQASQIRFLIWVYKYPNSIGIKRTTNTTFFHVSRMKINVLKYYIVLVI